LIKRTAELRAWLGSPEERSATRRGYVPGDRNLLLMFGVASSFASCVVLALFVSSHAALYQYRAPEILWAVIPLILFWQCRLWLATERGHMHDDPIVYASRDWVSWMVAVSVLVTLLAASWSPAIW
jgi:hypothetical protein